MAKPPEVSVIVPCYNMGQYISETIDSVLAQTFENFEIIIVDDCSNDGTTPAVITKEAEKDPRIKVISLKQNVKLPEARNAGIAKAKAPYILPLDSDDMIAPSYLQKTVQLIKKENADVVHTHIQYFGEDNKIWYGLKNVKKEMVYRQCVHPCALFTKSAWEEVDGYNDNMRDGFEDWDFWLSLVETDKKFVLLDEVLFHYRVRPNSLVTQARKNRRRLFRQIKKNHPSLFRWNRYYLNWRYLREIMRTMRAFRRKAFRIRFNKKGQKIVRLFGITFLDKS